MKAFVALGSNQGDRLAILQRAAQELQTLSLSPVLKSAVYETSPVDCPPGSPAFLNAVVELEVNDTIAPQDLLKKLQALETKLGRKKKRIRNEPRAVDLDLIACGDHAIGTADLILPHPRAHQRRFVLQPLCDLSPTLVLARQTKSVRELLAGLADDESVTLFATTW